MHEASLAQSIVETVLRYAGANKAQTVKSVQVDLGALTFFNIDQVKFWVKVGFENTIAQNARVVFRQIPGRIRCKACGFEGELKMQQNAVYHLALPDFSCPSCNNETVSIVQGKEAVVKTIRILKKPE